MRLATEAARRLWDAGLAGLAPRPTAGEMPPTIFCRAGAARIATAGSTAVGNASAAGEADSQKFSSADLTWLLASK